MSDKRATWTSPSEAACPAIAANLIGLARDYERWGLTPEAEMVRLRARQATIDRLLIEAVAAAKRSSDRPSR